MTNPANTEKDTQKEKLGLFITPYIALRR